MSTLKDAVIALGSVTTTLIAFEFLFGFLGNTFYVGVPIWLIVWPAYVILFLYIQIDTAQAKAKRGIKVSPTVYLWLMPVVPIVGIFMVVFPGVVNMFIPGGFLVFAYLIYLPLFAVGYEMLHPGWLAEWCDESNRKYLLKVRRFNKVMKDSKDTGIGEYTTGVALAFVGIGMGFVGLWAAFLGAPTFGVVWVGVIFAVFGLYLVAETAGFDVPKKSVIDGRPLLDDDKVR